jgi:hypothetical protein
MTAGLYYGDDNVHRYSSAHFSDWPLNASALVVQGMLDYLDRISWLFLKRVEIWNVETSANHGQVSLASVLGTSHLSGTGHARLGTAFRAARMTRPLEEDRQCGDASTLDLYEWGLNSPNLPVVFTDECLEHRHFPCLLDSAQLP